MDHLESVVAAHLDTWNAPAGPDRIASIAAVYSPDVLVGEPQGESASPSLGSSAQALSHA